MVRLPSTPRNSAGTSAHHHHHPAAHSAVSQAFLIAITVSTIFSLSLNVYLAGKLGVLQDFQSLESDLKKSFQSYVASSSSQDVIKTAAEHHGENEQALAAVIEGRLPPEVGHEGHQLAGLQCDKYGGPSQDAIQEMIYWEDIPADNKFVSPFKQPDITQYLSFEPDDGGWNNIRMNMETVLALAFAMGRTLVLPPEKEFYLLGKTVGEHGGEQKKTFSFSHFFHMESIHHEHVGLDIITMTHYLEKVAMKGEMLNRYTNKPAFPPNNRTNWDGASGKELKILYAYLREASHTIVWVPEKCMASFPRSNKKEDEEELQATVDQLLKEQPLAKWEDYVGKPVDVRGSPLERMKENWAARKKLCIYNNIVQQQVSVHMPTDMKLDARLLVHFYAFLYFQDWKHDLWMKRFVRDHVRYTDEIQCAAGRVVEAVRKHVKQRQPTNTAGDFDTFHIRRGDFQYKVTRLEADQIYQISKSKLREGDTVYIATDERDKSFFDPLKAHYDVVFLDDFVDAMGKQVNTNYYGMVDQLVASRGRTFFGCWFSTFTAYINRLRGYHADDHQVAGYEQGVGLNSWYYAMEDRFDHMTKFYPVKQAFYAREFPTSWRLIDSDVDDENKR